MSFISTLRNDLSASSNAKDVSRKAGEGVFANYVRATCYDQRITSVDKLETIHKKVIEELEAIKELGKAEKNSLRSAKCTVAKAVTNNVDVWQRDESGSILYENDLPMPKGKSELNTTKTDFQTMMYFIESARKKFESETRDVFTSEEQEQLAKLYADLAHEMIVELESLDN